MMMLNHTIKETKQLLMDNKLLNQIIQHVQRAQKGELYNEEIYSKDVTGGNEFLFFIKPEITQFSADIKLKEILKMIFTKIEKHNLKLRNVQVLSAQYLEDYDIIAKHYGVINKISNDAANAMSEDAQKKFNQEFGKPLEESEVLGSLQFIKEYAYFTPIGLDYLWQNSPMVKLAGGTYAQRLLLDGQEVFLVNGFHPRQLDHFTKADRSIVTMTLSGDTKWSVARQELVGATNPEDAAEKSIRNDLLVRKEEFGLKSVSSSWNGVHLSAGPVEGLVELVRYNSDYKNNEKSTIDDYAFGRRLRENFSEKQIMNIMNNCDVTYENKSISVFDLTEEKNSDEALRLLIQTMPTLDAEEGEKPE